MAETEERSLDDFFAKRDKKKRKEKSGRSAAAASTASSASSAASNAAGAAAAAGGPRPTDGGGSGAAASSSGSAKSKVRPGAAGRRWGKGHGRLRARGRGAFLPAGGAPGRRRPGHAGCGRLCPAAAMRERRGCDSGSGLGGPPLCLRGARRPAGRGEPLPGGVGVCGGESAR